MSTRTIDLANEISKILSLAESGEMDPQTIADTLEGIEGMMEDKFDATMSVIRDFEANQEKCKKEAVRLNERAKHWQRQSGSLQQYLFECLKATGRKNFKTALNTFSIRKGSISLIIDDEELLPDDYVTSHTEVVNEIDKDKIKKALVENLKAIEAMREKGEEPTPEQLNIIPGARVVRGEDTLSVR